MNLTQTERGDKAFTRDDVMRELSDLYRNAQDDSIKLRILELILENTPKKDPAPAATNPLIEKVRSRVQESIA